MGALAIGLLAGCSPSAEPPPAAPGVVARIDTQAVAAAELQEYAQSVAASLVTPVDGSLRRGYLRGLLARHLLAREARALGLDTAAVVVDRVQTRWRRRLIDTYRQEQLWPDLEVADGEVQTFFDSLGLGRQRQVAGILVEGESQAREILFQLRRGVSFEDLARRHSVHTPSAQRGGLLGFVSLEQARALGVPDEVFRDQPAGRVSGVLRQGERFQIVRFLEDRVVSLEDYRERIRGTLRQRRYEQQERQWVQQLAQRFGWRLQPAGLHLLTRRAGQGGLRREQLSPQEAAQVLFSHVGGTVTVGDYLDDLWRQPARARSGWGLGDSADVAAAAEQLQAEAVLAEAARQAGIAGRPEWIRWHRRVQEDLAITELRRRYLAEEVSVSPGDVRHFYEGHPDLFREADQLVLVEALLATEVEALALVAAVHEGASLSELAARSTLRPESMWEATLRLGEHERLTMPDLYEAARQATPGQLVGPVAVQGGYSVFRVVDHEPGKVPPLLQVEKRAAALARKQRQTQAFDAFVEDLVAKHRGAIHIYPEELEAALPDTFLQRRSSAAVPLTAATDEAGGGLRP